MKAQPYRLVQVCDAVGIISDVIFKAVKAKVRPKGKAQKGKTLWDIMKSDIS